MLTTSQYDVVINNRQSRSSDLVNKCKQACHKRYSTALTILVALLLDQSLTNTFAGLVPPFQPTISKPIKHWRIKHRVTLSCQSKSCRVAEEMELVLSSRERRISSRRALSTLSTASAWLLPTPDSPASTCTQPAGGKLRFWPKGSHRTPCCYRCSVPEIPTWLWNQSKRTESSTVSKAALKSSSTKTDGFILFKFNLRSVYNFYHNFEIYYL